MLLQVSLLRTATIMSPVDSPLPKGGPLVNDEGDTGALLREADYFASPDGYAKDIKLHPQASLYIAHAEFLLKNEKYAMWLSAAWKETAHVLTLCDSTKEALADAENVSVHKAVIIRKLTDVTVGGET